MNREDDSREKMIRIEKSDMWFQSRAGVVEQ